MGFKPAENTQAYLKAGFLGFQGAGKTFTASLVAIGILKMLRAAKAPGSERPVFFMDSETGSDYLIERFKENGIELQSWKTRAFDDLLTGTRQAEKEASFLIVDSVTHYWRELCDAYKKQRNRKRLEFQDWDYLKTRWAEFSTLYVNGPLHMIVCGRAGYEYDFEEKEGGGKDLVKTGIKMKTEGEFGFEPSLLVLMEREVAVETKVVTRTAYVLKDRFDVIDGKEFTNPTADAFMPHIQRLNLGAKHIGFETGTGTQIDRDGKPEWQREREQSEIVLDEIAEILRKHFPGQDKAMVAERLARMEKHGGTRSWERLKTFKLEQLKKVREGLWVELEGVSYSEPTPPAPSDDVPSERTGKAA